MAAREPTLPLVACELCAAVYRRLPLQRGEKACCSRCGAELWRHSRLDAAGWLAIALAALLVLLVANSFPVASLSLQGLVRAITLPEALAMLWTQGREGVALMAGLSALALPVLQILLLLWVLAPLAHGRLAPGFADAVRLLALLRPWCMVPVFLLGVVVSVVKLAGLARLEPGAGLAGFAALTVLATLLSRLSGPVLWRMAERAGAVDIHDPSPTPGTALAGCHACGQVQALPTSDVTAEHGCVRCGATVHLRKPGDIARTWALLLTAGMLYIPANVLPVMRIESVLGDSEHTILGGVIDLWAVGSWDLAAIVFVASVAVPMTKLLALTTLLVCAQRGVATSAVPRTRLYRMVEVIGQWSMLDVYVVVLLAALAHFQGLMQISAGPAAASFGAVVILTMLAAMSFDPRRTWDSTAQHAGQRLQNANSSETSA